MKSPTLRRLAAMAICLRAGRESDEEKLKMDGFEHSGGLYHPAAKCRVFNQFVYSDTTGIHDSRAHGPSTYLAGQARKSTIFKESASSSPDTSGLALRMIFCENRQQ